MSEVGKHTLNQRMEAIRLAYDLPGIPESERKLLGLLATYMPMDLSGDWQLTQKRLARYRYGNDGRTAVANVSRYLGRLEERGLIEVFICEDETTGRRRSNAYKVNWDAINRIWDLVHQTSRDLVPQTGSTCPPDKGYLSTRQENLVHGTGASSTQVVPKTEPTPGGRSPSGGQAEKRVNSKAEKSVAKEETPAVNYSLLAKQIKNATGVDVHANQIEAKGYETVLAESQQWLAWFDRQPDRDEYADINAFISRVEREGLESVESDWREKAVV